MVARRHTDRLAHLRTVEAEARTGLRTTERELQSAQNALAEAYDALVLAKADGDDKAATSAKTKHNKAETALTDTQLALDAARLRAGRAETERRTYHEQHADDLIAELEDEAHQIAAELADSARALVKAEQAWQQMAADVNAHLAAHPNATPAIDGPPANHGFEEAARQAKRTSEAPPPLPRWRSIPRDDAETTDTDRPFAAEVIGR